MGNLKAALGLTQVGLQSAIGTAVAATWRMRAPFEFSAGDVVEVPQAAMGYMMSNQSGITEMVERSVPFTIPAHAVCAEDLVPLLYMGIETSPVEATVEAVYAFSNAFDRAKTGVPAVVGMTLEHQDSDGTTDIEYEYADAFLTEWAMTFGQGQLVQFSGTGMANLRSASTFTDLSTKFPLTEVGYLASQRMKVYINDASSNFGTTQFTAEVLSGTLTFKSGFTVIRTSSGDSDGSYNLVDVNGSEAGCTLELVCLAKADAGGLYQTEQGDAEAGTLRRVRLEVQGAIPAGGASGSEREARFDFPCMHVPGSYIASGDESGQRVITMQLQSVPDLASANWFESLITTNQIDLTPP